MFVANSAMCKSNASVAYCSTGQHIEPNGMTWQEKLEQYNKQEENSDRLKKAGELYKPRIYLKLVEHFGLENVFILSAGWGLVRADFYLPSYDITFLQSAETCKKRIYGKDNDKFANFNHLYEIKDSLINEVLYFFGGIQYLNMYYDVTSQLPCQKIIYYKSERLDLDNNRVKGYRYTKYITPRVQNWHYSCAEDFILMDLSNNERFM